MNEKKIIRFKTFFFLKFFERLKRYEFLICFCNKIPYRTQKFCKNWLIIILKYLKYNYNTLICLIMFKLFLHREILKFWPILIFRLKFTYHTSLNFFPHFLFFFSIFMKLIHFNWILILNTNGFFASIIVIKFRYECPYSQKCYTRNFTVVSNIIYHNLYNNKKFISHTTPSEGLQTIRVPVKVPVKKCENKLVVAHFIFYLTLRFFVFRFPFVEIQGSRVFPFALFRVFARFADENFIPRSHYYVRTQLRGMELWRMQLETQWH